MSKQLSGDKWISFQLGTEMYVHPVDSIREIINYQPPIPVPGADDEVEGILNVRGEVITVFSGQVLLNLDYTPPDDGWNIIILDTTAGQIGISVNAVGEILTVQASQIDANQQNTDCNLIKGTVRQNDKLFILIDLSGYRQKSYEYE
jgi:purine-binding chemotaxis protein CheW